MAPKAALALAVLLVTAGDCLSGTVSASTGQYGSRMTLFGSRKLLQAEDSTVFGLPPQGTLVVTWEAVPTKHSPDFWGDLSPPDEYGWFSTYPDYAEDANLVFRPIDAYVAGRRGQKTQLTSSGKCNLTRTQYPNVQSLYDDCKGSYGVPSDLMVSAVWMLLQAPAGRAFEVPKPFAGINCSAPLFAGNDLKGRYKPETFAATVDMEPIPLKGSAGSALPGGYTNTESFVIMSLRSQPFDGPGSLSFRSINMRLEFEPLMLPAGMTFGWHIPYTECVFAGKRLRTVRSPTSAPFSYPTAPVKGPTGGACNPSSANPNQCFNHLRTSSVCCPGECALTRRLIPACKPPVKFAAALDAFPVGQGTCDATSTKPNKCFDSEGSYYVCCPGPCPLQPDLVPRCA